MKAVAPWQVVLTVVLAVAAVLGWMLNAAWQDRGETGPGDQAMRPAPIEAAPIAHGPIALRRTFSGELEALAEFPVAPKVSGRINRVLVNLADAVEPVQVVAELDDEEYVQAVAQAQADLAVARTNLAEAESALEIADREFKRTASLRQRGIASDSDFDAARQTLLARQAQLKAAEAQVTKVASALETATSASATPGSLQVGAAAISALWPNVT